MSNMQFFKNNSPLITFNLKYNNKYSNGTNT